MIVYPNSIVQHVIGTKNGTVNINVSIKSILHGKKDFSWNGSIGICKNR